MGFTFIPSGIDGAGFQNVVAWSPNGLTALYGGDVAGLHQSRDGGRTWRQINKGILDKPDIAVGAVLWETNSIAYEAAIGGLWYSTNADSIDSTWSQLSTAIEIRSGNVEGEGGLPQNHPRSVGRLMTLGGNSTAASRKWLYIASFNDGVYRTPDGTATQPSRIVGVANDTRYLRSIATDPNDNTTLYVGAYNGTAGTGGLYKVINANGGTSQNATAPTWAKLTTPFDSVEEVLTLGGVGNVRIYVVGASGSTDGVWKYSGTTAPNDSSTWVRMGAATLPTNANWCSIDGHKVSGGSDVIWVGAGTSVVHSGNLKAHLYRSTDAGVTWSVQPAAAETATTSSYVKNTMGDAGGDSWWHYIASNAPRLGTGSSVVISCIAINPTNFNNVLFSGRGGGWVTHNGDSGNSVFYPAVHNLNATINPSVISDPNVPGRVMWTSVDWGVIYSNDFGASVTNRTVGMSGVYCAWMDSGTTPGTAYIGGGGRDLDSNGNQTGGDLMKSANFSTTAFTSVGNTSVFGGKRPMGLSGKRIGGVVHLLTFVAGSGAWVWDGSAWALRKAAGTNSFGTGNNPANKRVPVVWGNVSTAYIFDPHSGLWRGQTGASVLSNWTLVWSKTSTARSTNYIALDPGDISRVVVATSDGLWRIENADAGTVAAGTATATKYGNITDPGPVGFDWEDKLCVWEAGPVPTYKRATNYTVTNPTWTDEANDYFRSSHQFPDWMDVSTDQNVYTAGEGTGAAMSSGLLLSGVGFDIDIVFGTPTIVGGQGAILPDSFPIDITFGTPTITGGALNIEPDPVPIDITFGNPTITIAGGITLDPDSFPIDITFGTPTITVSNKPGKGRGRGPHALGDVSPGIPEIDAVGG
jgi:hypothetical protein